MTGSDLWEYFRVKSGMDYTTFFGRLQTNDLWRNVMYNIADRKYLTLQEQKVFDEISATITTKQVFGVNNNKIFTSPIAITNITFGGGNAIVTTFFPHNLITGDSVTITGTIFTAPTLTIDGTYSVVVTGTNTFTFVLAPPVGVYTLNTGQIVFSKLIADYMHIYSVKCKYTEPQNGLWIVDTEGASPIGIKFNQRNKFRDGSIIQLSSMTGTPAANGTWFYRQDTNLSGRLYVNEDLTIPTTGGNPYHLAQGAVNYIHYAEAVPKFSDRDIDPFTKAEPSSPQWENADKFLKFYPENRTCSEVTMAYFTNPKIIPDANDTAINIELYYPLKFYYLLIDVTIRVYAGEPARDILLAQDSGAQVQSNP